MRSTLLCIAAGLSDEDLLQAVRVLAGRERDATVELVVHLAELDTRKLHLAQGYSSLFGYCTEALHLPSTPRTTGSRRRGRAGGSLWSSTGSRTVP